MPKPRKYPKGTSITAFRKVYEGPEQRGGIDRRRQQRRKIIDRRAGIQRTELVLPSPSIRESGMYRTQLIFRPITQKEFQRYVGPVEVIGGIPDLRKPIGMSTVISELLRRGEPLAPDLAEQLRKWQLGGEPFERRKQLPFREFLDLLKRNFEDLVSIQQHKYKIPKGEAIKSAHGTRWEDKNNLYFPELGEGFEHGVYKTVYKDGRRSGKERRSPANIRKQKSKP